MKLRYFSVYIGYDGSITGSIKFSDDDSSVEHKLNDGQVAQLSALIEQWKASLLDEAAAKLITARDDMLALEHAPTRTDLGVSSTERPLDL